ncbi:hypothetical protein B0H13DRAFT_1879549 [Mycena leptocephala]|nr:hypothetical protein B0H13DRAFT_1879549 [Mycena leptocephala]
MEGEREGRGRVAVAAQEDALVGGAGDGDGLRGRRSRLTRGGGRGSGVCFWTQCFGGLHRFGERLKCLVLSLFRQNGAKRLWGLSVARKLMRSIQPGVDRVQGLKARRRWTGLAVVAHERNEIAESGRNVVQGACRVRPVPERKERRLFLLFLVAGRRALIRDASGGSEGTGVDAFAAWRGERRGASCTAADGDSTACELRKASRASMLMCESLGLVGGPAGAAGARLPAKKVRNSARIQSGVPYIGESDRVSRWIRQANTPTGSSWKRDDRNWHCHGRLGLRGGQQEPNNVHQTTWRLCYTGGIRMIRMLPNKQSRRVFNVASCTLALLSNEGT